MKVSELGEFGLIDLLARVVGAAPVKEKGAGPPLILGIGDDAAAWPGDTSVQLATTDFLIEDVHFSLALTSWGELGWRAMAANLSDIAAMGGWPKYALVSLALPGATEVENVAALYQGMLDLARQFEVIIAGGDTSSAPMLIINLTLLGSTGGQDKQILTRSAAKAGEKIAVTGDLGAAAAGLEVLKSPSRFDPEATASLKTAFLRPCPRVAEGQILVKCGVRAAIDVSDGLVADLGHICQMSQVGARVEVDRVPIRPELKASFGDRALELALSGGEDYELLFTASAGVIEQVKVAASCPITVIGDITADKIGEVTLIDGQGNPVNLPRVGWEHFNPK